MSFLVLYQDVRRSRHEMVSFLEYKNSTTTPENPPNVE
jgi:hypothetical protein